MNTRTLAIVLGVALAASLGLNLFAATAAYTALTGQSRIEQRMGDKDRGDRRPSPREVVSTLAPDTRVRVRQALRQAGMAARPDFQQSRDLRRQAVAAAAAEPYDATAVEALLDQSRSAELRARERLEADALVILETLSPADRVAFAQILNNRGKSGGGGGGRDQRGEVDRS